MRVMTRLVAGVASLALLIALIPALPAHADASGGSAGWDVSNTPSDKGSDVSATLSIPDKTADQTGNTNEASLKRIGGETPEQYAARMRAYHEAQAARCTAMFADARSAAALTTDGAIMLRNTYVRECLAPGSTDWNVPPSPPPNPAVLGAEAVAQLHIANPVINVGPDPSINKWNMAVIGYPLWLWTDGPVQLAASAAVRGYTVQLSATRARVQFGMGDGSVVNCTSTTPWTRAVTSELHSPTCGYVYQEPSSPASYRIRAIEQWNVTWSVLGQSGTIPVTVGSSRAIRVGELTAVLVKGP